jgi:hypothetical protein
MIDWTRGDARIAQHDGYTVMRPGLVCEHLSITKGNASWALTHQPSGLRITTTTRQRDAKWLAERIVGDLERGGEVDEIVARIRPTMMRWVKAGREPWEDAPEDDEDDDDLVAVVEIDAPATLARQAQAVEVTAPVSRAALARWLDCVGEPVSTTPMLQRWALKRARTRVVVALVSDEEVSSVCEALEAVAWAYRREVADVVRMVEEVAV